MCSAWCFNALACHAGRERREIALFIHLSADKTRNNDNGRAGTTSGLPFRDERRMVGDRAR